MCEDLDVDREKIAMALLQYEGWKRFAVEQLDIEQSLLFRDLDRAINKAIKELCEIEGYDLVLMNDAAKELAINPESQMSRVAQVRQQMTSRRVLYVGPKTDITDELTIRMNNAFKAGNRVP